MGAVCIENCTISIHFVDKSSLFSREFEEGDLNIDDAFIAHNPTDVIDEEMIQYEETAKEEKDDLSFRSRQKQLPKWRIRRTAEARRHGGHFGHHGGNHGHHGHHGYHHGHHGYFGHHQGHNFYHRPHFYYGGYFGNGGVGFYYGKK